MVRTANHRRFVLLDMLLDGGKQHVREQDCVKRPPMLHLLLCDLGDLVMMHSFST